MLCEQGSDTKAMTVKYLPPYSPHVGAVLEAFHELHPKPKSNLKLKSDLPQTAINEAINNFRKHLNACVSAGGGHFEHTT